MCWTKAPGTEFKIPAMLVWYTFSAFTNDEMKEKVKKFNSSIVVKPGGLISILKPLDVCINRLFKDTLWKF